MSASLRMDILGNAKKVLKRAAFVASLPPLRRWVRGRWEGGNDVPPVGLVRFGSLRRLTPISTDWGDDRGGPVDRYYIERFLKENQRDIRGRVLEIGDDVYTRRFGETDAQSEILVYDIAENERAAYVGDLSAAPHLPSETFDCVVMTQTLQLIYEVRDAVETLHRILKPGGVVLLTAPGISQINRRDWESWGDFWCWNFTALSLRRLFAERFPEANVDVHTNGNVLVAASFLYGLGRGELTRAELDHLDPDYEVLITVRAEKEKAAP